MRAHLTDNIKVTKPLLERDGQRLIGDLWIGDAHVACLWLAKEGNLLVTGEGSYHEGDQPAATGEKNTLFVVNERKAQNLLSKVLL